MARVYVGWLKKHHALDVRIAYVRHG
jgi:hypothetical protein